MHASCACHSTGWLLPVWAQKTCSTPTVIKVSHPCRRLLFLLQPTSAWFWGTNQLPDGCMCLLCHMSGHVCTCVCAGLTFIRVLPSSVSSGPLGAAGPDAQVLLPPSWQASVAAGNLVDEANKAFFNTGIK